MKKTFIAFLVVLLFFLPAYAQKAKDGNKYKEIVYADGYEHDKWGISPTDHVFKFRAYTTSFDGDDDNDGDGIPDKWGIPEWVSFEVQKKNNPSQGWPAKLLAK